ncbi:hypothetical protein D3C85_1203080 [compost metagenome]
MLLAISDKLTLFLVAVLSFFFLFKMKSMLVVESLSTTLTKPWFNFTSESLT